MKTTIDVIRHGIVLQDQNQPTLYGPERPLSQVGREGIQLLARNLKNQGIGYQTLYCSPYIRTQETAHILAQQVAIQDIVFDQRLVDVKVPGWIGKPIAELQAIGYNVYGTEPITTDQETLGKLQQRALKVVQSYLHYEHNRISIVSHGDLIAMLLYSLEHPNRLAPNVNGVEAASYYQKVVNEFYPERGSVVRLYFDNQVYRGREILIQAVDQEGRRLGKERR